MPVNQKVMKSLKDQYGSKKGKDIYYAMENKGKKMAKGGLVKSTGKIKTGLKTCGHKGSK